MYKIIVTNNNSIIDEIESNEFFLIVSDYQFRKKDESRTQTVVKGVGWRTSAKSVPRMLGWLEWIKYRILFRQQQYIKDTQLTLRNCEERKETEEIMS